MPVIMVDWLRSDIPMNGTKCEIQTLDESTFLLVVAGAPVASCPNAERLSSWAFEQGAFEVRTP